MHLPSPSGMTQTTHQQPPSHRPTKRRAAPAVPNDWR
jgi:hypothetical protein